MQINEKVNGDKMSVDQEKLINQQIATQEELERKQLDEARKMNRDIEDDFENERENIDGHMVSQKKLVRNLQLSFLYNRCCPQIIHLFLLFNKWCVYTIRLLF